MTTQTQTGDSKMAKPTSQNTIDTVEFDTLGIGQVQEVDRFQLAARGAMTITRIRFDYRTKYWNEKTKEGTPVVKIDGIDGTTQEPVKYWTLSSVIYKTCADILTAVGAVPQKDSETGDEWMVLKKAVNVGGFEEISTGVRGQNPYLKVVFNRK